MTNESRSPISKPLILAFLPAALLVSNFANSVQAQEGHSGAPGAFLMMGVGARALGMGGAYSAIANDVTAIYWNPAGLATQDLIQISFTHTSLFLDTSVDFFAAMAPTARFGSFALAFLTMQSNGFEQRTALNEPVGEFGTGDQAFLASWSREWFRGFALGVNYKFVRQTISSFSGGGHGVDLGVKMVLFNQLSSSLVLRNLVSPKVTLYNDSQNHPKQISAGLARSFFNTDLVLSAEYSKISGWGDGQFHLGAEYNFQDRLALRVGMGEQGVTVGAGFALDRLGVEYSNSGTELGTTHRFSLNYSSGGLGVRATASPRLFSPTGELNVTRVSLKVKSRNAIEAWSFTIKDPRGRVVWAYDADGQPPAELVWDGRDNAGSLVPDGTFKYVFNARTVHGKEMRREGVLVTIDSSGPIGEIASDGAGQ